MSRGGQTDYAGVVAVILASPSARSWSCRASP
jgi:hypothetical protein